MYRVSIEFWYESTSVLSRMTSSDWLRYSSSIKQLDYDFEFSIARWKSRANNLIVLV